MSTEEGEVEALPPTAGEITVPPSDEKEEETTAPAPESTIAAAPEEEEEEDNDVSPIEAETTHDAEMKDSEETVPEDTLDEPTGEAAPTATTYGNGDNPAVDAPVEDTANKSDDATSKSEAEQATEDSTASKELHYSTRGRSTDKEASSAGEDKRSSADPLDDIGRVKEPSPATLGQSFLETLTEEERRTRTRFIPEVDGMHALRKHEVKDDLSIARSLVSSSGITSLKKSKKRTDDMDVDEEGGRSPSDDGSTDARPGTKSVEFASRHLDIPSSAFVSSKEDTQTTSISSLKTQNGIKSPLLVDAVSGFDPPRPPESVGAKKKHRMLRWERRPEDVEVDLNNYKKTVQKTRQELQKAEAEYNRLETIDAHLRWHFLNHLDLMKEEYSRLDIEIGNVQQKCLIESDDMGGHRTRRRNGSGRHYQFMKDAFTVLKTTGAETGAATENALSPIIENVMTGPGIGGLSPSTFNEWDRNTEMIQKELASAWTVPGEMVKTPYGEGTVVEVFPPESVPGIDDGKVEHESKTADNGNADSKKEEEAAEGKGAKVEEEKEKTEEEKVLDKNYLCTYLMPRVSVKLPFGVGYFPISSVESLDNPCLFSDAKLVERWTNIIKTATAVGATVDLEGMSNNSQTRLPRVIEAETKMDLDAPASESEEEVSNETTKLDDDSEKHFMPFGAGLLPTASGRGNLLHSISIDKIEKALESALYDGHGVLGRVSRSDLSSMQSGRLSFV